MKLKVTWLKVDELVKTKKPAKPSKQAVANLKSEREPEVLASRTIASSISVVVGSFLISGLAKVCCRPSRVALTNESLVIGSKPALEWTQDKALHASSTAALELVSSPRCCR